MSSVQTQSVQTGRITRTFIYLFLLLMALFYLLPFFIMVVNSVKPLSEITGGNMMACQRFLPLNRGLRRGQQRRWCGTHRAASIFLELD